MNAGRELDVQIAEEVMGHSVTQQKREWYEGAPNGATRPLRNYSMEMGAAWEVVEKLAMTLIPIEDGSWFAMVGKSSGWKSPAEFVEYLGKGDFLASGAAVDKNPALCVCMAALTAIQKKKAMQSPRSSDSDQIH